MSDIPTEFMSELSMSVSEIISVIKKWPLAQMNAIMVVIAKEMATKIAQMGKEPLMVQTPKRSKKNAKQNEEKDVTQLIRLLNDPDSVKGQHMRSEFQSLFGLTLLSARQENGAGGRPDHYDFEIETEKGWLKVEHKGSFKKKKMNPKEMPWKDSVQFYNGPANKFTIGQKYAEAWYHKYIGSCVLKERYHLRSSIPSLGEWIKKDGYRQGAPATEFGKELKRIYHKVYPGASLDTERNEFVKEFAQLCTETDLETLKKEALPIIQEALNEKEVWLRVAGDVTANDFNFLWYPSIIISEIISVKITIKSDISFVLECNDGIVIYAPIRWGNGQGFSNIRLDLK